MTSIVDWKASFLVEQKELKEKFVKGDGSLDSTVYATDGLHPNAAGAESLGRKMAAFINMQ